MGLFPYQPTIDYAFKYSVISDVILDPHFVRPERYLANLCSVLHLQALPYGCIFFPQQVLFTLALSFRREVPFLAMFSGTVILTVSCSTIFAWTEAMVPKSAAIG